MIFNCNAKVLLFSDMCKFLIKKIDVFIKNVLKNLFIRTIFSNFAQNLNQMNAQKDFERNVKIACRKKKISQKELAKQLGVKEYAIKIAKDKTSKVGAVALKQINEMLLETDYAIKSGEMPADLALNYAILKINSLIKK